MTNGKDVDSALVEAGSTVEMAEALRASGAVDDLMAQIDTGEVAQKVWSAPLITVLTAITMAASAVLISVSNPTSPRHEDENSDTEIENLQQPSGCTARAPGSRFHKSS
ncbi:hypothetical protein [Mycobacterium sp. 852013-50091_SCH5140682]|uniref:hypothetical protein n=1 Tax=Mycobacterium sp. 852013-50091_SCH5140682 TaxID=1834109 RepID=UPI0009EDF6E4|nr:hypothetical protein [Mycobacterium sp. 852013-50091_SCH5140682]